MPRYFPIEAPEPFQCVDSDLKSLCWRQGGIVADFALPFSDKVLRVRFARVHIVRILDEMPLSTETEPSRDEGVLPNHFAYRVEGALFWASQSATFFATAPKAKHYRFVTGWTCLDVIADDPPTLTVEAKEGGDRP
jgi:hypothetical protein